MVSSTDVELQVQLLSIKLLLLELLCLQEHGHLQFLLLLKVHIYGLELQLTIQAEVLLLDILWQEWVWMVRKVTKAKPDKQDLKGHKELRARQVHRALKD